MFKIDQKLSEILKNNPFTVSAEVIPPRNGSPQQELFNQISKLTEEGAQFLSVTKGAGGSLRAGSLPIAQVIKDHFQVPAIAHFTCRDLTREDVENQLLDHHYFGIRNILALRGDPPQGVLNWKPHPDSYPYAFQLIEQIQRLNQGIYLERKGFDAKAQGQTDFCIGAAAYPDEPDRRSRIEHFRLKVQAGAEYGITQMIYDVDSYSRFLDEINQIGCSIPILPGFRILKDRAQAERVSSRFQIPIPDSIMKSLPISANTEAALDVFNELVEKFRKAGAPGIHLFVLSDTELSALALRKLKALIKI